MLKLVDITYHTNAEFITPFELLLAQNESLGYARWIKHNHQVTIIKHMGAENKLTIDGVDYCFFRGPSKYFRIPFKTLKFLFKTSPDVIIVQGFIFPLQVLILRLLLSKKTCIILQHHGEQPSSGLTFALHRLISQRVDGYLFTALENSKQWLQRKIISEPEKCYEVQEASTAFVKQDKISSKFRCGITGNHNFIWVGRLNANKDPLTVLAGFENYLRICPEAKLYMIYQTEDLLDAVNSTVAGSECLQTQVILKGKVDHEELVYWYSACDFYISGSHTESCGFSLIESMACGCIPVVTNIPSFNKITGEGKFGFLYKAGDVNSLIHALGLLRSVHVRQESEAIVSHFQNRLSFKSIADSLHTLCSDLSQYRAKYII